MRPSSDTLLTSAPCHCDCCWSCALVPWPQHIAPRPLLLPPLKTPRGIARLNFPEEDTPAPSAEMLSRLSGNIVPRPKTTYTYSAPMSSPSANAAKAAEALQRAMLFFAQQQRQAGASETDGAAPAAAAPHPGVLGQLLRWGKCVAGLA